MVISKTLLANKLLRINGLALSKVLGHVDWDAREPCLSDSCFVCNGLAISSGTRFRELVDGTCLEQPRPGNFLEPVLYAESFKCRNFLQNVQNLSLQIAVICPQYFYAHIVQLHVRERPAASACLDTAWTFEDHLKTTCAPHPACVATIAETATYCANRHAPMVREPAPQRNLSAAKPAHRTNMGIFPKPWLEPPAPGRNPGTFPQLSPEPTLGPPHFSFGTAKCKGHLRRATGFAELRIQQISGMHRIHGRVRQRKSQAQMYERISCGLKVARLAGHLAGVNVPHSMSVKGCE